MNLLADHELPALDDLDALDQDRAADMIANRPLYGPGDDPIASTRKRLLAFLDNPCVQFLLNPSSAADVLDLKRPVAIPDWLFTHAAGGIAVSGDSGTGKSSLLARFAHLLARRGMGFSLYDPRHDPDQPLLGKWVARVLRVLGELNLPLHHAPAILRTCAALQEGRNP